jgi:hypothetical protein
MVSLEDNSFRDGAATKQLLWQYCQPIIEEWVGRKVQPTSTVLWNPNLHRNFILATRNTNIEERML